MIKHIWFDFSETIATIHRDRHNKLRYDSYSKVVGKPVTSELIQEYEELCIQYPNNNSAVFNSLGMSASYWSEQVNSVNPGELYRLKDEDILKVLEEISKIIPISIFSNINQDKTLPALGIDPKLFTHILTTGVVRPKPALDGFYKMIELSNLKPEEILYIGDHLEKDVLPAKKVGIKSGVVFENLKDADYSFENFKQILEFVKANCI